MSEVLIVLQREFRERVLTRGFVLSTLLFPVFMGSLWILPAVIGSGGGERRVVIVDETPAGIGAEVERLLSAPPAPGEEKGANRYRVERVAGPFARVRGELTRRVQAEEIDGFLHLPAGVATTGEATYRARSVSNFEVLRDLRRAASQGVQAFRLRQAGLDGGQVAALVRPVEVKTARITDRGEEGGSAFGTFLLAYVVGFLTYLMITLYGVNVQRSVLEEKTNRIAEVILSSMRASHLMLGKILGVGLVAMLQVSLWVGAVALLVSQSAWLSARFGIPPGAFDAARVQPGVVLAMMGFFVGGFFLYSSLFAAVGAAVNSDQEAQQFQVFVLSPLMVSLIFFMRLTSDPLGQTATVLGLVPFTAPLAMPMRMGAAPIPAWQVAASLGGLFLSVLAVAWIAGKVYRVGLLSTGKKPTLRDLARWLRAA